MKLYFSPLACSLATRIALYEAGADVRFVEVDPKTKKTEDGKDFLAIHPLGLVPGLEVDGELLTENAAILSLLAERYPELAPANRARLLEWIGFINTELHKGIFSSIFDRHAPAEVKSYAVTKAKSRFDHLAQKLEGKELLFERFTVADAYLFTVLNWAQVTPIELDAWPAVASYLASVRKRPSVARAFEVERPLYLKSISSAARAPEVSAPPTVAGDRTSVASPAK